MHDGHAAVQKNEARAATRALKITACTANVAVDTPPHAMLSPEVVLLLPSNPVTIYI